MTDTGFVVAGDAANSNAFGTRSWKFVSRITLADSASAYCDTPATGSMFSTNYLVADTFRFSVPGTATIVGVEVAVNAAASAAGISSSVVSLGLAGGPVGSNKGGDAIAAGALVLHTYGSTSDMWGTSLTPADVNSRSFGAVVAFLLATTGLTVSVDYISIRVTYTTGAVSQNSKFFAFFRKIADWILGREDTGMILTQDRRASISLAQ